MLLLSRKQLIGLSVVTKDGRYLGRVKDFQLDVSSSQITNYIVSSSQLVEKILAKDLVINKNQVISIDEHEMVVESTIIKEEVVATEMASSV